ncbi:MAG: bifunctional DNA primase/polymerase [Limisphaerales bacterium]
MSPDEVKAIRAQALLISQKLNAAVLPVGPDKVTKIKQWQKLTVETSTAPASIARFGALMPSIGVVLGNASNHLCSIDCDSDEGLDLFLAHNPKLQGTLISRGARGANLWVRIIGDYPKLTTLKRKGEKFGEFRSDGGYTVIWGPHPGGNRYWSNDNLPLEIRFDQIDWFDIEPFSSSLLRSENYTESQSNRVTESTDVLDVADVADVSEVIIKSGGVSSLEEALQKSTPKQIHTNNGLLFTLARGILSLEHQRGSPFTPEELKAAFNEWHCRSLPYLRPDQTKEEYWIEFMNARKCAKVPIGQEAIQPIWEQAQREFPPEADRFETRELKLLVSLCWHLQKAAGDKPFYLAGRTFERLIGNKCGKTIATWLRYLTEHEQILQLAERGTTKRAARYRYLCK